jgi:N-acetylglutamate synthase-like GNAT family acetyltransferase
MTLSEFEIRALRADDRPWVAALLAKHWGGVIVVSKGQVYHADTLPGFAVMRDGQPVGLATYHIDGKSCELVSLDSLMEGMGIGTALIEAVTAAARRARCERLWLITTNDNLHALRFYQKRGFVLAALHRNAMEQSRRLKPQIPLVGLDGIPLRDEIELESSLEGLGLLNIEQSKDEDNQP